MIITPTGTHLPAGTYVLDADASEVTFTTRHMFGLGAVSGSFTPLSAAVDVTEGATVIDATISAASFASGDAKRDAKVKSSTFLDSASHPDITFHAERIQPAGDGWTVEGELTVRGTSAQVILAVPTVQQDGGSVVATATTVINRYAFGVTAMRGMAAGSLKLTITARFTRI